MIRQVLGALILVAAFNTHRLFAQDSILVISSAGGHRSAANAIEAAVTATGRDSVRHIKTESIWSPGLQQTREEQHWQYLRRIVEKVDDETELQRLQAAIEATALPLKSIITTDYPTARALSILKVRGRTTAPIAWVHVDLDAGAPYPDIARGMDRTFVGSENVRDALVDAGVPPNKLAVSGFPLLPFFAAGFEAITAEGRVERRRALTQVTTPALSPATGPEVREVRLNPALPTVMLMGGSWGLFEFTETVLRLDQVLAELGGAHPQVQVIALTARNTGESERLRRLVESGQLRHVTVHDVGFVDSPSVLRLQRASDVVVSKPGGATVFELLYSGAAVIYLNHMVAPHEDLNMREAVARGAAVSANDYGQIGNMILDVLTDPMAQRQQALAQHSWAAAQNIGAIINWGHDPDGVLACQKGFE